MSFPEPDESVVVDEALLYPWQESEDLRDRVDFWIDFWSGRGSQEFRGALERMGRYEDMVLLKLSDRDLPESLKYLPIFESSYSPNAVSPAGAAGLWQFMAPTARGLGLTVNSILDERRDPVRSTEAALEYLLELQAQFQSWYLALAAYNAGPGRVGRIVERYSSGEPLSDELYVRLWSRMPRETRDFVPKFIAVSELLGFPERYGLSIPRSSSALRFVEVTVPSATSIDIIAEASESSEDQIRLLNPQFVEGVTPPRMESVVRIPVGKEAVFAENYERIPEDERVTFLRHRVQSGETFTHIARAYGVTVDNLVDANPELDPRRLRIGQTVIVTRAPGTTFRGREASDSRARVSHSGQDRNDGGWLIHVVASGESLWTIARYHDTRVQEILSINGLEDDVVLFPGDEIRVVRLIEGR